MAENPIENFYDSRGIRIDVYVKDSGRIFNIEIQTGNYDDLILRARYYLSSSDVSTTNAVGVCPRCILANEPCPPGAFLYRKDFFYRRNFWELI